MINLDSIKNKNIKKHNKNWPYIPGPGSGKTNALLNLINKQGDIDKIYLYAKRFK